MAVSTAFSRPAIGQATGVDVENHGMTASFQDGEVVAGMGSWDVPFMFAIV
ncbi:hypothetical protein MUK42_33522 [Musa troglodytarum]|uniref:Uncharacterized protein n=1 Tax=Musa troglodytarum TaxID=320322 RepID=A0A9E7H9B8_9LILI|nr:hypothetical protein MUK42_33522 [Musa troglodytarum]